MTPDREPLTEWPADDAPITEWLRPLSARMKNIRDIPGYSSADKMRGDGGNAAAIATRIRWRLKREANA